MHLHPDHAGLAELFPNAGLTPRAKRPDRSRQDSGNFGTDFWSKKKNVVLFCAIWALCLVFFALPCSPQPPGALQTERQFQKQPLGGLSFPRKGGGFLPLGGHSFPRHWSGDSRLFQKARRLQQRPLTTDHCAVGGHIEAACADKAARLHPSATNSEAHVAMYVSLVHAGVAKLFPKARLFMRACSRSRICRTCHAYCPQVLGCGW